MIIPSSSASRILLELDQLSSCSFPTEALPARLVRQMRLNLVSTLGLLDKLIAIAISLVIPQGARLPSSIIEVGVLDLVGGSSPCLRQLLL